jgi:putative ABC transport system permease protein
LTPSRLILRNLQVRRFASTLTSLGVALGVMLVSAILLLRADLEEHFLGPQEGYSLLVGAPGSALQLVLNTVYHVDQSPGLMPLSVWRELQAHPSTRLAVPYAVGDSFRGFRVVATTEAFFDPRFPHPKAADTAGKFAAGTGFVVDAAALESSLQELGKGHVEEGPEGKAVVGHEVAEALGLRVGDRIEPTHGVGSSEAHEHEQLWEVVGILRPSGTPIDRVVLISLDSFYRIPDHAGGLVAGTGEPGLSAVVLTPKAGMHKTILLTTLNKRPDIQVASADREVRRLLGIVGRVDRLFLWVSALVVLIAIMSVLVSLYATMRGRRREIATLRAIGAPRWLVFRVVAGEAAVLVVAGAAVGVVLGHVLLAAAAGPVEAAAGFSPNALRLLWEEAAVFAVVCVAGALAGTIPAFEAYRTDVARALNPGGTA